jgi:nucleotide-binding universal stress UspA family protein
MKPLKKILVPVDFSRHSQEATQMALGLAERFGASVKLVHVYQPLDYGLPDGFLSYAPLQLNELISALEKHLEKTQQETRAAAGSTTVTSTLLHGAISSEITRCAKDEHFDLIVMGTHGRTGIGHVMLGSVAEKVLRTAPCPVLTVRAEKG